MLRRLLPVLALVGPLACADPPTPESEAAKQGQEDAPENAESAPLTPGPRPPRPTADDMRWAKGSFKVALDGSALSLPRMPLFENSMTVVPDQNVSRMTITAHGESGWPKVQLFLFGHRPDQIPLPAVLPAAHSEGKSVELRYWPKNDAPYSSSSGKEMGKGTVFLDKLEGNTLTGRFEGELFPAGGGDPVKLTSGAFEVELKARALRSRPAPDGDAKAAPQ